LYHNSVVALINNSIDKNLLLNLFKRFKPSFVYQSINDMQYDNWDVEFNFGNYILYKTNYHIDYKIEVNLSTLLMTSGSTGDPEFVRLSYSNLYSNTLSICNYLNINNKDIAITTLPMSYSYGISIINTHLFSGAGLVLTNRSFMEKDIWEMINDYNVTTFGGVPYTYEILKKLKFHNMKLPNIKYMTQAGGKLNKDLLNYFIDSTTELNIDFYIMYGQTEASPRMSYLPPKMINSKKGSIGIPIPGGKFDLIDEKEKIINQPNVEGELIYEGENVCMGYANNCYDLGNSDINDGILRTGDIAKFDTDGYYYITGRKKRFLKLFGNRISLDHVEQMLNQDGFECVCAGTDNKMNIYTINFDKVNKIKEYVKNNFNLNYSGFEVIKIKQIPRSESGKILYSKFKDFHGNR
tara:strand:+ start:779 stop:2005 length:1227 start_codon:yes stop_codon:yes gene_type:complete